LRNALANEPAVAFQAVLHNFVLATFYRFAPSGGCLEMRSGPRRSLLKRPA
jgi:ParB family transcriptional regulator, chromosome partitioning protein